MSIKRSTGFEREEVKGFPVRERHPSAPDMRWIGTDRRIISVFVLDKGEVLDSQTKGVGNGPFLHGPGLVVTEDSASDWKVDEYHVNDPKVWNWITNSIRNGWLNSDTIRVPEVIAQ